MVLVHGCVMLVRPLLVSDEISMSAQVSDVVFGPRVEIAPHAGGKASSGDRAFAMSGRRPTVGTGEESLAEIGAECEVAIGERAEGRRARIARSKGVQASAMRNPAASAD